MPLNQHPQGSLTWMGSLVLCDIQGDSLWHFARPSCRVLAAVGTRITDLIHPHAYPRVNQKQLHWFLWHPAHPAPNGAIHKNPTNFPWGSVDMALALGGRSQPSGVILWTGGKNQPSGFSFLILSMLPGLTVLIINPQAWNSLLLLFCMAATTKKKKAAKMQETWAGCPWAHLTICVF